MKEYYLHLQEEYNIPIKENLTDEELHKWMVENKKQTTFLIDNYGESSWNIHRFMELCRAEDISESFFRELVRKEMDKCFRNSQRL